MSINVNDKNLGHATAYAYYKAGGGTMTEAEFTEFMADFGTASQTAVEAAQAALASETAAQTAATTATNKASEATTAATTATTKAAEAQADADAAALDASQALSAASTATTKASEATTAAATATSAATTATTAKDDAVSAKTAAQTAQTGAETAAASVQSSAAQIATNTDDIAQLKNTLSDITDVMHISPNLLNLDSNIQANSYIEHDGTIGASNNWTAYTDYIPIEANTSYTIVYWNGSQWNQNTSAWYAFYDASYTATSGAVLSQAYPANAGNNDAFIRVSFSNTIKAGKPMLIKLSDLDQIGSTLDSYMPVGNVVINGLVVDHSDILDFLTPTIVLPSKCRAVVGTQFNIYTENVLVGNNLENYTYFWTVRPYTMAYDIYSDCLRFTPTDADIGTYTVTLEIKRKTDFVTVASKSMTLEVVANTARTNKSVVFIGDSLTNVGIYAYEIEAVLSNNGVESIGTVTSTPWIGSAQMSINTEGRGGWSIEDYMTKSAKSGVSNAFWNPSTNKFDFSYWLTNNNFQLPDIVFINLGTNGVEHYDINITGIKDMVDSIRTVSDTVPICISLITPPATQDGWTYANHGGSAAQFKAFEMTLNARIIEEFDNKEDEYIYLSPVYFNLDRYHDYNTAEFPVSARNPEVVTLQTNNVHPSRYGYLKFADVYWAMIQKLLT